MNFALLGSIVLVFAGCQHVISEKPNTERVSINYFSDENFASLLSEYEARFGFWDLWESIKNAISQFWDFIKNCAKITVDFIKKHVQLVQEKTKELFQKAKERLVQLREEFYENLRKWSEKSQEIREIVAKCYEEEQKQIQEIFDNSLLSIQQCVDRALSDIARVEAAAVQRAENTTSYMNKLKDSLENCKNSPHVEECLADVKDEIVKESIIAESDYVNNRAETKRIIDDLLEEVSKCVTREILKTANVLAKKVVDIGICVNRNLGSDNQLNIFM